MGGRRAGPDDEGRVPDPAVGGAQPQEVETARPVAGSNDAEAGRSVAVRSPVDPHGARHRGALGLEVAPRAHRLARVVEDLEPERGRVRRDPQLGLLARRVAAAREGRLDALDADDRRLPLLAGEVHVDAPAHGQPQDIGPRLGAPGRAPDEGAATGSQAPRRRPDRLRRPALMERVRSEHVHADGRGASEPKAHDRAVAEAVPVRRDRRQQPVVGREALRSVRDAKVVQPAASRKQRREPEHERAHRSTTRIGTPRRDAANGTLEPWTMTENKTTTNTIS